MADRPEDDIFLPSGRVRADVTDDATARALRESGRDYAEALEALARQALERGDGHA